MPACCKPPLTQISAAAAAKCQRPKSFLSDINAIFDIPPEEIVHMQKYNRKVIAENYSIEKMTDDYEHAYSELFKDNPRLKSDCIISGYYGYRNIGDDSALACNC